MTDIDPLLLRLRETEARFAFAEYHVVEQRALANEMGCPRLQRDRAAKLLRSMEDSMAILRLRRNDLLETIATVAQSTLPSPPASWPPGKANRQF